MHSLRANVTIDLQLQIWIDPRILVVGEEHQAFYIYPSVWTNKGTLPNYDEYGYGDIDWTNEKIYCIFTKFSPLNNVIFSNNTQIILTWLEQTLAIDVSDFELILMCDLR